jgi:hypothetical protein
VQAWLAVALKVMDPEGAAVVGVGGAGIRHVVRQFAATELQFIMQFVTVEVIGVESPGVGVTTFGVVACASRISSSAEAWYALQQIVAAKTIIARARMTLLRYRTKPF